LTQGRQDAKNRKESEDQPGPNVLLASLRLCDLASNRGLLCASASLWLKIDSGKRDETTKGTKNTIQNLEIE
jgi:hypothetical protein